jgi:2-C-methyl-D-erythritol 4-phosphate cytidylyltransferase
MKKYAVIVAAGSGNRMGSPVPKQFLHLLGKPIVWYTLTTFLAAYQDLEIILVVDQNHFQTALDIVQNTGQPDRIIVTGGGKNRFYSVKNGLEHIKEQSIVFIHDGVRCLVSVNLIHRCYEKALETGNAVPAIEAIDSVRLETTQGNKALNRKQVKLVQTPQTFYSDVIKRAFEQEFDPVFTDEASLCERIGIKIHLVDGEQGNIKITTPVDLLVAEKILTENASQT